MADGDRTGWLPWEDSNRQMSNLKTCIDSTGGFPLISERFGTGDFSPVSCPKLHIHPSSCTVCQGVRIRTGLVRGFWEIGRKIRKQIQKASIMADGDNCAYHGECFRSILRARNRGQVSHPTASFRALGRLKSCRMSHAQVHASNLKLLLCSDAQL
jgi:hypothetical protein